jgi:hypothetical protein
MPPNKVDCGAPAAHRYTWPGRDESFICETHSKGLLAVASAMGLYLQLLPAPEGTICSQQVASE